MKLNTLNKAYSARAYIINTVFHILLVFLYWSTITYGDLLLDLLSWFFISGMIRTAELINIQSRIAKRLEKME